MKYFRSCALIYSVLFCFLTPCLAVEIETLSLQDRVGQLFIVGFEGTSLSAEVKRHLADIRPGGAG